MAETCETEASEISLVDFIDRGGFEASIITSFNANLRFYEEIILHRLQTKGCRRNVVLMDAAQCAATWKSEATRPRTAGVEYTLIPMHFGASFHPKVTMLLGPKKAAVSVGSHNLTSSGFGINRELTSVLEFSKVDPPTASFVRAAWDGISRWLHSEIPNSPGEVVGFVLELAKYVPHLSAQINDETSPQFLAQSDQQTSLFGALRAKVNFVPTRVAVLGAFFDHKLAFLHRLKELWPYAELKIGVDPGSVYLPQLPGNQKIVFVDASEILNSSVRRYLHAKALYLEDEQGHAAWLSGSANPSSPGWGLDPDVINAEAVVLIAGEEARRTANSTHLIKLFDLPALSDDRLSIIVSRTKTTPPNDDEHETVALGIASESEPEITVDLSFIQAEWNDASGVACWTAQARGASDTLDAPAVLSILCEGKCLRIRFAEPTNAIRSLDLFCHGVLMAHVLVHHSSSISKLVGQSAQRQIREAIGSLDSSSTDLSLLIETVSKVIFSGEAETLLNSANEQLLPAHGRNGGSKKQEQPQRPESLEVSAVSAQDKRKKKILSQGDLVALIEALIHKLYVAPIVSIEKAADGTGGTEDGNGDGVGGDGNTDPGGHSSDLSDADIAHAVTSKANTLIRRMIKREKAVSIEA